MLASTKTLASVSSSNMSLTCLEKLPERDEFAATIALSLWALIKSATDSAWARSILSFRKAFFVNSPGSATTAPNTNALSIIKLTIIGLP